MEGNVCMRVCFKCTDFFDDEVLLTGFAFGGLSEVSGGLMKRRGQGGGQRGQVRMMPAIPPPPTCEPR